MAGLQLGRSLGRSLATMPFQRAVPRAGLAGVAAGVGAGMAREYNYSLCERGRMRLLSSRTPPVLGARHSECLCSGLCPTSKHLCADIRSLSMTYHFLVRDKRSSCKF